MTLVVFLLTAAAWIFRPLLRSLQWGEIQPLQGLTAPGIAIFAALVLFVIPANSGRAQFVMDWKTAVKLPWGLLILFGGGLCLASVIDSTGGLPGNGM